MWLPVRLKNLTVLHCSLTFYLNGSLLLQTTCSRLTHLFTITPFYNNQSHILNCELNLKNPVDPVQDKKNESPLSRQPGCPASKRDPWLPVSRSLGVWLYQDDFAPNRTSNVLSRATQAVFGVSLHGKHNY